MYRLVDTWLHEVAEDVEPSHEVVVEALEEWIVEYPGRLRNSAHGAPHDERAIEMPVHREDGVGVRTIAVPNVRQDMPGGHHASPVLSALSQVRKIMDLEACIKRFDPVASLARNDKIVCHAREKVRMDHGRVGVGGEKENEKVLVDDIERNLPLAHRPVDERFDVIERVVEHELVSRSRRDRSERNERIRCNLRIVRNGSE
jgi:hypothetical protein